MSNNLTGQPPVPSAQTSALTSLNQASSTTPSAAPSQPQSDRHQISQTLDKIHTTASQSVSLTTFTEIGSPRESISALETKNEGVSAGLTGLYNRFKGVVSGAMRPAQTQSQDIDDSEMVAAAAAMAQSPGFLPPGTTMLPEDSSSGTSAMAQAILLMSRSRSSIGSRNILSGLAKSVTMDIAVLGGLGIEMPLEFSRRTSTGDAISGVQSLAGDSLSAVVDDSPKPIKSPEPSIRSEQRVLANNTEAMPMTTAQKKLPTVIHRIRPRAGSQTSSHDLSFPNASPMTDVAHGEIYNTLSVPMMTSTSGVYGTPTAQDIQTPEMAYPKLAAMGKRVLSKEFWMADETSKECYLCSAMFTAFRRKHHCRLCGMIFDSKCTTTVPGEYFGVQGSLKICIICHDFFQSRLDDSSDSDAEAYLARFAGPRGESMATVPVRNSEGDASSSTWPESKVDSRPSTTPVMAIAGTRTGSDGAPVLEIETLTPQLSRAPSSKSLKTMTNSRPHTGHKRHHSKHSIHGMSHIHSHSHTERKDDKVPFRKPLSDKRKTKLSAFHDDNIIDPELEGYMSDDQSSGDEQGNGGISSSADVNLPSFENDRGTFGSFLSTGKRHRMRVGEKSISGLSFTRGATEEYMSPTFYNSAPRPPRRRNLSMVSSSGHFMRPPRPKSGIFKFQNVMNEPVFIDSPIDGPGSDFGQFYPSDSAPEFEIPQVQLSPIAETHFKKLLRQLLTDNGIENVSTWEKVLSPIIQRCTDEVSPDTDQDDFMDIRHYVKIKKIPGAKAFDSAYTAGIVFSKNVALKSMSRKILKPKILLLSFPLEYQRHSEHQLIKLDPVISQEREYLRIVVSKIIQQGPHLILSSKGVSGIALQSLSEANISVAYNVKQSVMEAVARCADGTVVESVDMLALPDVRLGSCRKFEVRTFVNNTFPGSKKSYIFLSDCMPYLGGTITLRGANVKVLARLKQIVEFMIYVVYNLKLENSLLRDSFVNVPEVLELPSTEPQDQAFASISLLASKSLGQATAVETPVADSSADSAGNDETPIPPVMEAQSAKATNNEKQLTTTATSVTTKAPTEVLTITTDGPPPVPDTTIKQAQDEPLTIVAPKPVNLIDSVQPLLEGSKAPTSYYSDIVDRFDTKILSSTPFVKFTQPYLLQKARLLERRLNELGHLKEYYGNELVKLDKTEEKPQETAAEELFQLVTPEMLHAIGQKVPEQVLRIIHAAHEVEYDNVLHAYETQRRLWEGVIQGNIDLCDPNAHQTLMTLQSVICTTTKIPCVEPNLVTMRFYIDRNPELGMETDGTLGQFLEKLYSEAPQDCPTSSCSKTMMDHHRTYVHDHRMVTVFTELNPAPQPSEVIMMWSYCKVCKKDMPEVPMSEHTYRYSFCKYLEFLFWGQGLRLDESLGCPHDFHMDHIRYFTISDIRVRLHLDPIDPLEIAVPRKRFTWKVDYDIKVKNNMYMKYHDIWLKFMASVVSRLKSIRIDSVLPEKADTCKEEIDSLLKKVQDDQKSLISFLQEVYMNSKYYELVPFNLVSRKMMHMSEDWNMAFKNFEADFLSDKDIRQITMLQLRKMFVEADDPAKEAVVSEGDAEERAEGEAGTIPEEDKGSAERAEGEKAEDKKSEEKPGDGDYKPAGEEKPLPEEGKEASVNEDKNEMVHPPILPPKSPEPVIGILKSSASPEPGVLRPSPESLEPKLGSRASSPHDRQLTRTRTSRAASPAVTRSPARSVNDTPGGDLSLSERIEMIRRDQGLQHSATTGDLEMEPRPRLASRRTAPVMPMLRSGGQGHRMLTKPNPAIRKESREETAEGSGSSGGSGKKFSERLGLNNLTKRNKGSSAIPRLNPKRTPKVSALAKHFEQLSREFEQERIRDRKKREEKERLRQPRSMLPRTSTTAIVVYDNVDEAVGEPDVEAEVETETRPVRVRKELKRKPIFYDQAARNRREAQGKKVMVSKTRLNSNGMAPEETDFKEPPTEEKKNETKEEEEGGQEEAADKETEAIAVGDSFEGDGRKGGEGQGDKGSGDEAGSDNDASIDETNQDSDILGETPGELPKHQKNSLLKMLANFWAERSASGWAPLDFPISPMEHIFLDSDIVIREDEPSSLIAFALSSMDYRMKLAESRYNVHKDYIDPSVVPMDFLEDDKTMPPAQVEEELERELLSPTGSHLKFQFQVGSSKMHCKIFFAGHFDAMRRKCMLTDRFIDSLSRCIAWDSQGGKSKSVFLKTMDDRLVLKSLAAVETTAFLEFAPSYFGVMAEALFRDLPSVIAKMVGLFQIYIKNPVTSVDIKLDLLVMENLFYDRAPTKKFDLKGSMRNRKVDPTGAVDEVLLDQNMVDYIYESPLFAREHSKRLLRSSVYNDTLFLSKQNVMDYSLMVAIDASCKELVVGIVDCIRTYTFDKKLETWIKDRSRVVGQKLKPTVTDPREYKSRFREAMQRYILQAPDCWRLFPGRETRRQRFEDDL